MIARLKNHPWSRIDFSCSPEELIDDVLLLYDIGQRNAFRFLTKGVIEVNIFVQTSKGAYVIKVFSNKHLPRVNDILLAQQRFYDQGVSVPKLLISRDGITHFVTYSKSGKPYYGCVICWFDGIDYSKIEPTSMDLRMITQQLVLIHQTRLEISEIYDDCFPLKLPDQFKKSKKLISDRYLSQISDISQGVRELRLDKFRTGVIHGDLSREHVLKNSSGDYCILDFGGVNINPLVADLAFMMSYYCLDRATSSVKTFENRYRVILDEYLSHCDLSSYELSAIPIIIQANYALCYILGRYFTGIGGEYSALDLLNTGQAGLDFTSETRLQFC